MSNNLLTTLARYETYESIRDRMLSNLPSDINKGEDSFIYNAICPIAYELYSIHFQLLQTLNSQYIDTATDQYLTQLCSERGVQRLYARPLIISACVYATPYDIAKPAIGTLFRNGTNIFKVVSEPNTLGFVNMESLTNGNIKLEDTWSPVSFSTFSHIVVGSIIQTGADDESDAELRERFKLLTQYYPFGGNKGDYIKRIKEKAPSLSHIRVVSRKEDWTDHNVEVYLLKDNLPLLNNELAEYEQLMDFVPVGHIVKWLTPNEYTTDTIHIQAQVPLGSSLAEIEEQIRYQLRQYSNTLLDQFEVKETLTIYNGQIIGHLLQTIPSLLNLDVQFNSSQTVVTIPYNTLPNFNYNNISIQLLEV